MCCHPFHIGFNLANRHGHLQHRQWQRAGSTAVHRLQLPPCPRPCPTTSFVTGCCCWSKTLRHRINIDKINVKMGQIPGAHRCHRFAMKTTMPIDDTDDDDDEKNVLWPRPLQMNETYQHPGSWEDTILVPTLTRSDPTHFIMSHVIKGLSPGAVYEVMIQARNNHGWNEVRMCSNMYVRSDLSLWLGSQLRAGCSFSVLLRMSVPFFLFLRRVVWLMAVWILD